MPAFPPLLPLRAFEASQGRLRVVRQQAGNAVASSLHLRVPAARPSLGSGFRLLVGDAESVSASWFSESSNCFGSSGPKLAELFSTWLAASAGARWFGVFSNWFGSFLSQDPGK